MTEPLLPRAVLFDIDGTLVDSNYLHVDAWQGAFADVGHPIDAARIHRLIGADADRLLDELLGEKRGEFGDAAKARHAERYQEHAPRLRRFAHAKELLTELSSRGVRVVLATSAPPEEFAELQRVIDADDVVDAATTGDDVETAKPEPDLIGTAVERAGVRTDDAVMIGDTVWDAVAAGRAGVRTIGVLSGGISEAELRAAGAASVFDDVAAILDAVRAGEAI